MDPKEFKYSELTSKIIGCAMRVHSTLGHGFQEVIYQRALALEFRKHNIPYERERTMSIYYDGVHIGTRRVDFLVAELISVEIKAFSSLEPTHFNQALNYLEILKLEVGLLINFGEPSLNFRRLTNKKFKESNKTDSESSD
jgi:GxxExxY protein